MNEFFTWELLATYAGATLATGLITQMLKGFDFIAKLHTQLVSYVVALVLLLAATFFLGMLTVESAALCLINAVIVALASNGGYDAIASMNDIDR